MGKTKTNSCFFGILTKRVLGPFFLVSRRTHRSATRTRGYIKSQTLLSILSFASIASLSLLLYFVLSPLVLHSDSSLAATGTAQQSTLTLAVNRSAASVNLAAIDPSGSFAKSTSGEEASFSVTTNNYTGYTLTINGLDDYGTLISYSASGEESLASISSSMSEATFDTAANNGKWGWKPNKINSAANTNFLQAPTTEGVTIEETSTPNATANNYTIALGARADYTNPAGAYYGTFILTAVANRINYSVTYNKNTTDNVTNMPYASSSNTQSGDTDSTSITLSNLVPVRSGYIFRGWCSVPTSDETCSGTTYNPNGTGTNLSYGIDQTTINVATLYAMWELEIIEMQEMTLKQCTTEGVNVKDTRDNQIYLAKKLADEKCWMVENLNLPGGTALSPSDTDVTSEYISNFSTSNNLTRSGNTIVLPNSSSSGFNTNNYSYVYNSGNKNCGTEGDTTPCYSYYSWDAATLGSGRNITTDNTDAEFSICPKGWRLPTAYSTDATDWQTTSDYYVLAHQYGLDSSSSTTETDYINDFSYQAGPGTVPNFLFAGVDVNSSLNALGAYGYYWSSTTPGAGLARNLNFVRTTVDAAGNDDRSNGASVRCVLDVKYLQDQTDATLAMDLPNVGDTKVYYDSRDEEEYIIAHLADDKYWFLDNLRLDPGNATVLSNITPDTTNASENAIHSFKYGGGTSTDQYATGRINSIEWVGFQQNHYTIPLTMASHKDETVTTYGAGSGKVGVYYNYCAATAGSYCQTSSTGSGPATEDICPAGWRMPTGGLNTSSEYVLLAEAYGGNITRFKEALSLALSGVYGNSTVNRLGQAGLLWSSTYNMATTMNMLEVTSSNVTFDTAGVRAYGSSVRCLFFGKPQTEYLQDQTASTLAAAMPLVGDTHTYYDKRDGGAYIVGHLADDNYWFLDNLNLDITEVSLANLIDNTNASAQSLTYLKNGGGSSPYPFNSIGAITAEGGSWSNSYDSPFIATGGYGVDYRDIVTTSYGQGSGKTGVYYNYCAATAGSFCYPYLGPSTSPTEDICPANWQMPKGDTTLGSYYYLYTAYNSDPTAFVVALSTSTAGMYYDSTIQYHDQTGVYWSSTGYNNSMVRILGASIGDVQPTTELDRDYGFSVRCMFKQQ